MENFFLSRNSNFGFELFDWQHKILLIITLFLFLLLFIFREKISTMNYRNKKIFEKIIIAVILINMFLYRGSYIYYGVYDIKKHLSLYYCHIVNYLLVISLIIKYKPFYKIVYTLSWIGSIWTIIFPDISGGFDCYILYTSFISHNLLIVFTSVILVMNSFCISVKDTIKGIAVSIFIFLFTYAINKDFGTKFNSPYSILKDYVHVEIYVRYMLLIIMGVIGAFCGYIVNKILRR